MMPFTIKRLLSRLAVICPGGFSLRPTLHRVRGVTIGQKVWLSQQVYLDELHPEAITIGDNCTIGRGTAIFCHLYHGPRRNQGGHRPVTLGKNVFIGPHCVILPGVTVGDGSVIKAGSVLTRNVPPGMFWGPPACGPLARVTVPLTSESCYDDFVQGLRPISKERGTKAGK